MNSIDQFLLDAIANRTDACTVRVDYTLPKGSMIVSPDVFSVLRDASKYYEPTADSTIYCGVVSPNAD